ncbi:5-dehydro-4-deoxy-D-glucuronate isomerase [Desulforhopalus sp. 52FAK]
MEMRYAVHPDHAAAMDTEELRDAFLLQDLFVEDSLRLVYSHNDRLIMGAAVPVGEIALEVDPKTIGAAFFLQRRELGVINIGGAGVVTTDGDAHAIAPRDGIYIGRGVENVRFTSDDPSNPAKFYFNSTPAHRNYPTTVARYEDAAAVTLGDAGTSNRRTIRKFIHPEGIQSCQLVMGMTALEIGSVWNTMPTHTHERRMEAYCYFDLQDENVVFHFMGEPAQTRHLIVRQQEVVLSPSWSIHSGTGTSNYTFIWGMAGENQTFDDMDGVPMSELR